MMSQLTPDAKTERDEPKFIFQSPHRVYYNTRKALPVKEVILALQGLDGLLKPLPLALSSLTGIEINGAEYLIQNIESGSLTEDIIVRFFFKDRASLDAFIDKLSDNKVVKTTVITAVIAGIAGYGLHMAMADKPAPSITATNSVIIQNGAGSLNISNEAFSAAIAGAVTDKKAAIENALKFIGPARMDSNSSVQFDGGLSIPPSAIAEATRKIELQANERLEEFVNTLLTIRATNLDSKKSGWAGRLGNRDDRLPIELDPSVRPEEIFGKASVPVDAALIYKEKGKSRELKPSRIYVRRITG
jgi:hypothetical protein